MIKLYSFFVVNIFFRQCNSDFSFNPGVFFIQIGLARKGYVSGNQMFR